MQKFAAGEMVWQAGEPVQRVVLVAKGKLAFVTTGRGRSEKEVVTWRPPPGLKLFRAT